ncbi:discoidin domain-containing protein [Jiangella ureilytica]|uniref:discoidin domain-containing protein n=1 Tax=Jiangella ureilytica TaxID=2530374 RepID=UPI0013A5BEFC|nr:discoidin domain-containing protein [Jiangella ureilytica]
MAVCGACGYRVSELALECGRCRGPIPTPSRAPVPAVPVASGASSASEPFPPPPPPPSSMPPPSPPMTPSPVLPLRSPVPPSPPAPPAADQADGHADDQGDDRAPVSRGVIAIVAAAAVILVVMIVVIAAGGQGPADDDPAGSGQARAELAAQADLEVPGTAPDGVDSSGNEVGYAAANLVDGDPSTAWRVEGDASDEEIVLTLPSARTVTEVGIVNGYAKIDDDSGDRRYGQNRRVLAVTWIFDDGTEASFDLEETPELQTFTLDAPVETTTVRVRLDEVSDPGGRDFTAVGELSLLGS